MRRTETGWILPVYLSEGTYTYRFIADGTMPPPTDKPEYNENRSTTWWFVSETLFKTDIGSQQGCAAWIL